MKLWIFLVTIILCLQIITCKTIEKTQRKKDIVVKKKTSKAHKLNASEFRNLPSEDLQFIKDLDKQFKLHGNNIRFKIEALNSTQSKNTKRTIDGNLGYGYHNQNHNHGYYFSEPKYMIYPYSQHDIPPPLNYGKSPTSVTIQPSHSFELKEVSDNYGSKSHGRYLPAAAPYQPLQHFVAEPVIILRIPGPAKYAAHLQSLLQQYLEIRAAQYLKALQESEAEQYQHYNSYQPQYYQEEVPVSTGYGHDLYQQQQQQQYQQPQPEHHTQQQQQQQYQHQPVEYVYQYQQHQHVPQSHYQVEYEQQSEQIDTQDHGHVQHQGYNYNQGSHDGTGAITGYIYPTPIYDYSTAHDDTSAGDYEQSSHSNQADYDDDRDDSKHNLPISENYPSHTHTKVVFTNSGSGSKDISTSYPLPSTARGHPGYQHSARQEYDYSDSHYNEEESVVSVNHHLHDQQQEQDQHQLQHQEHNHEQPYNYHPHAAIASKGLKRNIVPAEGSQEEQYVKLNKLISRLKKKDNPTPEVV